MAQKHGKTRATAKVPQKTTRAWDALTPALSDWILEAVNSLGFDRMTPVQASTIPLFLGNKDPVVEAVTGSGKTLAFLIPIVERLLKLEDQVPKHHVGVIIISPTRELATQIHTVLLQLLAFHAPSAYHIRPVQADGDEPEIPASEVGLDQSQPSLAPKVVPQLLLGGKQTPQADLSNFLKNSPNVIISTPGRLLELLTSPYVHTPQSSFQVLVMDEADRLLDMGFQDTLQKILQRLPKQRRTGLFSASVNDAVERLVRVGIQNPYRINVRVRGAHGEEDSRTPASLAMHYLSTPAHHKLPTLIQLLSTLSPPPHRTIVYLPTCALVDYLYDILPSLLPTSSPNSPTPTPQTATPTIISLHGQQNQAHRLPNLTRFTTLASPTLLLTTDVASRGLDIPAVDLTVQLDPPTDEKSFLHRAGRAGRAGRKGLALLFLLHGRETDDYPSFLAVRRTPVTPLPASVATILITPATAAAATATLRKTVKSDRALHDDGQRALPSYVQAYRKHSASSIFRVEELPWGELAEGLGLLRMPRMPELRKSKWDGDMSLDVELDWRAYGYKDKKGEGKRLAKLDTEVAGNDATASAADGKQRQTQANTTTKTRAKMKQSWSTQTGLALKSEERRDRKRRKRNAERTDKLSGVEKVKRVELNVLIKRVKAEEAARAKVEPPPLP